MSNSSLDRQNINKVDIYIDNTKLLILSRLNVKETQTMTKKAIKANTRDSKGCVSNVDVNFLFLKLLHMAHCIK